MTSPSATRPSSRVKMRAVKSEAPVTMSPLGSAATDQTEMAGCCPAGQGQEDVSLCEFTKWPGTLD
jgi:hypothetical protein